jgi:hypothetical protein
MHMAADNQDIASDTEKASNLRAIFEILSYIHVDAAKDDFKELADRIEFALNLAEKLIRERRDEAASVAREAAAAPVAAESSGAHGPDGYY